MAHASLSARDTITERNTTIAVYSSSMRHWYATEAHTHRLGSMQRNATEAWHQTFRIARLRRMDESLATVTICYEYMYIRSPLFTLHKFRHIQLQSYCYWISQNGHRHKLQSMVKKESKSITFKNH